MRAYMVRHTLLFRLSSIGSRHVTCISLTNLQPVTELKHMLKKTANCRPFCLCEQT